jgi:hypothetical protein
MTLFTDLIARIISLLFKLVLFGAALVFVVSLLLAGVVVVVVTVLLSLLTGRKPKIVTTFTRFRQASQQFRPGVWPGERGQRSAVPADIVDVQAHEVPDQLIGTNETPRPPETRP